MSRKEMIYSLVDNVMAKYDMTKESDPGFREFLYLIGCALYPIYRLCDIFNSLKFRKK